MDNNPNTQPVPTTPPPEPQPPVAPPVQPEPSLPSAVPLPSVAAAPAPAPVVNVPAKKGKLPIWALVLSILGLISGAIVFVSFPLALVALILGIVALKKRAGRKGMSIASVIISAFTLVVVFPIMLIITIVAYNGITERAQDVLNQANDRNSQSLVDSATVDEQCYRFALPSGYTVTSTDNNCDVTLSDGVSEINVTLITGEVPSLSQARETLRPFATSADGTLSDGEIKEFNDVTAYVFDIEYSTGSFALYLFLDDSGAQQISGQTVTGYSITGRSDTFDNRVTLELITDTFTLKS